MGSISIDLAKKPFDSKKEVVWKGYRGDMDLFLQLYMEKEFRDSLFTIKTLELVILLGISDYKKL